MFEFIGHTISTSNQQLFKWFPALCRYFKDTSALSRFAGRLSATMSRGTFDASYYWVLRGAFVVSVQESIWRKHVFSFSDLKNHG
jgi:hypothetical protein